MLNYAGLFFASIAAAVNAGEGVFAKSRTTEQGAAIARRNSPYFVRTRGQSGSIDGKEIV